MISLVDSASPSVLPPPLPRRPVGPMVSRGDVAAAIGAAVVTLTLEFGAYFLARRAGRTSAEATTAFLAAASLWLALAPAALAAGGSGTLGPLLRGGAAADATGLGILILWLLIPCVPLRGAIQVYAVAWSMALPAIVLVWVFRRPVSRLLAATATAGVFTLLLASLLWLGARIGQTPSLWDTPLATWAVRINPFCAMTDALADSLRFVWHEWGRMYLWTPVGQYALPAPAPWYEFCLLCLGAAALPAATAALLRFSVHRRLLGRKA